MRPASSTTDRHRHDVESQSHDEGCHQPGHDSETNQNSAPRSHLANAVGAPMLDAAISTSAPAIEPSVATTPQPTTYDENDYPVDLGHLKDIQHFDTIAPDHSDDNLVSYPPTRPDLYGSHIHHQHDIEDDDLRDDDDLDMSDDEGGVLLNEGLTSTNFLLTVPDLNDDIDTHIPEADDEDQEPPSFPYNYFVPYPPIPFHGSALEHDTMNPLPDPGPWPAPGDPTPQLPMFDPIVTDPSELSNPNPTMLGSVNLGLMDFLQAWAEGHMLTPQNIPPIYLGDVRDQIMNRVNKVRYDDLAGDYCDMQGMNWAAMGLSRSQARVQRAVHYKNYVNKEGSDDMGIDDSEHPDRVIMPHDSFFRFKKMQIRHDVHLAHFQLRSVLACPGRNEAFYSASRGINRINPITEETDLALNSEHTSIAAMISTLDANHGVLMAGTFGGEYCLKNLDSEDPKNCCDGSITNDPNGISNHMQIYLPRGSGSPVAAVSSNDYCFRVMDLSTETFISKTRFPFALNCSAVSPDRRLRVMVGDNLNVLIVDAEKGEVQQRLSGHRDYGFACDWSDDGVTVATGFQDKGVKIWDARWWCNSQGVPMPVATLRSEIAGVRGLRFSPVGSGPNVLVAAEEADFVNIIDAQTFETKQTVDIFGEIGGIAFANDGQELNILCCDRHRGGLLQLDRCGLPFHGNAYRRELVHDEWQLVDDDSYRYANERFIRRPTRLGSVPIF